MSECQNHFRILQHNGSNQEHQVHLLLSSNCAHFKQQFTARWNLDHSCCKK